MDNEMEDEEQGQKKFNSSLSSRVWKIGALTTGVSTNIITNKIRDRIMPKKEGEEKNDSIINSQLAERIVKVMGELKGPWMKMGQYLSLHDASGEDEFLKMFSSLHYESPSMSFYFTKMQIETELGKSPDFLFKSFGRKPIGAASIGQVHEAYLKSGEKVAVKVQYPDMDKIIKSDITTLKIGLMPLKVFMKNRLDPIINEVESVLVNELDYTKEAKNLELFREFHKDNKNVVIPEHFESHTSKRVLTMKFIEGKPFEKALEEENYSIEEKNHLAHIMIQSLLHTLFNHNMIHADPHPGNFLIIDKETIALLDFGCIKVFEKSFVDNYKSLVRSIIGKDPQGIRQAYVDLGFVDSHETEKLDALEEFSDFLALPYRDRDNFDLGENINKLKEGQVEFKKMSEKVGFRVPKDFIYLNRTVFGLGMILFKMKVNMNFYKEIEAYL
jgi:predicted unusual protein kinase regulating ubiquinone biosynthesis (AarF/ABC1/UbiB family)